MRVTFIDTGQRLQTMSTSSARARAATAGVARIDPRRGDVRDLVDWGAGPRAGQFLINGGKALAAMDGRFSVSVDDVPENRHPRPAAPHQHEFPGPAEGLGTDDLIRRLLKDIPSPTSPNSSAPLRKRPHPAATAGRMIGQASMQLTHVVRACHDEQQHSCPFPVSC